MLLLEGGIPRGAPLPSRKTPKKFQAGELSPKIKELTEHRVNYFFVSLEALKYTAKIIAIAPRTTPIIDKRLRFIFVIMSGST